MDLGGAWASVIRGGVWGFIVEPSNHQVIEWLASHDNLCELSPCKPYPVRSFGGCSPIDDRDR